MRIRHVWLLAMLVGCRGCACTNAASALTDSPDTPAIEQRVRERLEKEPQTLSTICGVPVSALKDMALKITSTTLGISTVHVEGTAVREADASIDVGKALVCAGVLMASFVPILGSDGKRTGWTLSSMDVDSVETPGVSFTKPSHHHHHHH